MTSQISNSQLLQPSLNLVNLPNEIIHKIIRCLPFKIIAQKRSVCRLFNQICSSILNSEFQSLRNYTHHRFQMIKSQMPRRESARRKHPLARECDIIEIVHMRLNLLQMTFGKHIERGLCCFFAGEVLDEVHRILNYVKNTPNLSRAYKVTDELFDLSTMAMEFFKEYIEPNLPEINYFANDLLIDYSPMLTSSPQSQLFHMDSTTNIHHTTISSKLKIKNQDYDHSSKSSNNNNGETVALKRKFKQLKTNIKRNGGQITVLRRDLLLSKRKLNQQQRLINKLRSRFTDYDKKFENTSRKLNVVLEELSKCKTELQYWRSKSPSNSTPVNGKTTPCNCENFQCILPNKNDIFQPIVDLDFNSSKRLDEPTTSSCATTTSSCATTTSSSGASSCAASTSSCAASTSGHKDNDNNQVELEPNTSNCGKNLKRKLDYVEDSNVDNIRKIASNFYRLI